MKILAKFRTTIPMAVLVLSVVAPSASHAAFPGTNGKIAFVGTPAGYQQIFVMNADGSGLAALTDNEFGDFDPAWSPDGTKIAFTSNREAKNDIWVMNADGTSQTKLFDDPCGQGQQPAWSPDGTKIVFQSCINQIRIVNADGTGLSSILQEGEFPAWSPDGTKIAFTIVGGSGLFVMDPDGGNLTRLVTGDVRGSNWSPDGTKIVFSCPDDAGNTQICVINADGTGLTHVTNAPGVNHDDPVWSPDGTKIVFVSDRDHFFQDIFVMNGDGTGLTNLTNSSQGAQTPDWQPRPAHFIEVDIDIKPGSFPNSVNPRSKGVIPVAIMTTDSFDATGVDLNTVLFGKTGNEAAPVQFAFEDVDLDGDIDMILHFNTQATGIQCGDTSASLTGKTFSGQAIEGADSVNTVGCK